MNSVSEPVKPQLTAAEQNPGKWEEIRKKIYELNKVQVKPYTLKELSGIYKSSVPTFKRMLVPHQHRVGQQTGRYYTIRQVKLIFQHIDPPSKYNLTNLAQVYGVSIPTMRIWLDKFENELGERTGRCFSMRQLYIIITRLDIPTVEGKEHEDFIRLLRLCA